MSEILNFLDNHPFIMGIILVFSIIAGLLFFQYLKIRERNKTYRDYYNDKL